METTGQHIFHYCAVILNIIIYIVAFKTIWGIHFPWERCDCCGKKYREHKNCNKSNLITLNDIELMKRVAKECNDKDHDDRWCPTCSNRFDGIDDYNRELHKLIK
jgi:hypothetical protein